jgi:hypothetical protein
MNSGGLAMQNLQVSNSDSKKMQQNHSISGVMIENDNTEKYGMKHQILPNNNF